MRVVLISGNEVTESKSDVIISTMLYSLFCGENMTETHCILHQITIFHFLM